MKFKNCITSFLNNIKVDYYFNLIEFLLFLCGIILGVIDNMLYIYISIFCVFLVYIIKCLLEINDNQKMEILDLKKKISSIFIKKDDCSIIFAPYVFCENGENHIKLLVNTVNRYTNVIVIRAEYSGDISEEKIIFSQRYENASNDGDQAHKYLVDNTNFKFYKEENLSVVKINSDKSEDGKYFEFNFKYSNKYSNKISYSLEDNTGKILTDIFWEV